MILTANKDNITAVSSTYPFADYRDEAGLTQGTPLDREALSDYVQFFEKMFDASGDTANNTPDNFDNGFQLFDAFRKLTRPYKVYTALMTQTGTNNPTANVLGFNDLGAIVWVRDSVGVYSGTLTGAFVSNKTWIVIGDDSVPDLDKFILRISANEVSLRTANTGVFTDGLLSDFSIEIRVYD